MSAKIWQKWLSVIGLVLILLEAINDLLMGFTNGTFGFNNLDLTSLGVLLIAITVVIGIFSKKK